MAWSETAYKFYRERTALVIVSFFLVGGVLIWASTALTGAANSVVLSLGVSALSLAAFSTISEYFLKTALTDDILSRIQMQTEVATSGFVWVKAERDVPWAHVVATARDIDCVVKSPEAFQQNVWPHLMAAAKERTVRIQVLLPSAIKPHADSSARTMEKTSSWRGPAPTSIDPAYEPHQGPAPAVPVSEPLESDVASAIDTLSSPYLCAKHLEESWKSGKASKAISARCELRVAYLTQRADSALLSTDHHHLILLGPPQSSHEDGTALMFEGAPKSFASRWVTSVVTGHADAAEDSWTDMKKKGPL